MENSPPLVIALKAAGPFAVWRVVLARWAGAGLGDGPREGARGACCRSDSRGGGGGPPPVRVRAPARGGRPRAERRGAAVAGRREQRQRDHACAARRHGICAARCSVAARDVGFLRCYSGGANRLRSEACSLAAALQRCSASPGDVALARRGQRIVRGARVSSRGVSLATAVHQLWRGTSPEQRFAASGRIDTSVLQPRRVCANKDKQARCCY